MVVADKAEDYRVTCPTCSKALLFGSHECSCGWKPAAVERPSIDLSYWEALAVFWRIGWTSALFVFSGFVVSFQIMAAIMGAADATALVNFLPFQWLLQHGWSAVAIFLFTPLMLRWPYRGFALVIITGSGQATRFLLRQRLAVTGFIFIRSLGAALLGQLMLLPLNIFFGMLQVRLAAPAALAAMIFAAGPLIIRLLIGHPFKDFRLEADRSATSHRAPGR